MISLGVAYDGREPEALAFIGQFAEVEQLVCRDAGDGGDIFEPACTFRFHSYLSMDGNHRVLFGRACWFLAGAQVAVLLARLPQRAAWADCQTWRLVASQLSDMLMHKWDVMMTGMSGGFVQPLIR